MSFTLFKEVKKQNFWKTWYFLLFLMTHFKFHIQNIILFGVPITIYENQIWTSSLVDISYKIHSLDE